MAFRGSGYQDAIDFGIFEQVASAVLDTHELDFIYSKTLEDGTPAPPEQRRAKARVIVCVDHAWYLITDDPLRPSKFRTFALCRMLSAKDTGIPFTPEAPLDLEAILGDSLGIHTGGKVDDVEVLFHPCIARYVREHFWHKSEKFSAAEDGRLRLTMRVAVNPEVERSGCDLACMQMQPIGQRRGALANENPAPGPQSRSHRPRRTARQVHPIRPRIRRNLPLETTRHLNLKSPI